VRGGRIIKLNEPWFAALPGTPAQNLAELMGRLTTLLATGAVIRELILPRVELVGTEPALLSAITPRLTKLSLQGNSVGGAGVFALHLALVLTLQVDEPPPRAAQGVVMKTPWADLGDGIAYARSTPPVLAALLLACLANFAAYPLSGGLLPHVARDVYGLDRTGLGYLSASFAGGAMLGSLFISARGGGLPPARTMLAASLSWFLLLLVFARLDDPVLGGMVLALAGFVQSFCMVPLAVLLLRITLQEFRGRVMGLRMLAVYGLPVGLMMAGPLVAEIGFADAGALYAGFGVLCTIAIALFWRAHLLPRDMPANGLRSQ
jgi:hypothetical protein